MKFSLLHVVLLLGALGLAGCQSPRTESLDVAARKQAHPIRIEFTRPSRIYESGDAIFAMVNDSRQLLWFVGQGPESPVWRLKVGATGSEQEGASIGKAARPPERFPLPPGETRYFEIKTGPVTGSISVGVTFYASFSGINGIPIWSSPATVPFGRD